nr:hypothetical protein [Muribaculaceae bacterium]
VSDSESIDNNAFIDSDEQDFEDLFNFQNRNSEPNQPQNTSNPATHPSNKSVPPKNPDLAQAAILPAPATASPAANTPSEAKKISSIIVFYTDGTFTTFRPAEE